jgi:hemoglobin
MSLSTAELSRLAGELGLKPADPEAVSLYDAIGGRPAVVAAVDVFYRRVLADPELSPFFPGGVGERHRRYLATFLAEALGGPRRYRGPDIAEAHRGLRISGAHFALVAGHLDGTLDELGVPRHLTDQIIAIVAGLHDAVVTA